MSYGWIPTWCSGETAAVGGTELPVLCGPRPDPGAGWRLQPVFLIKPETRKRGDQGKTGTAVVHIEGITKLRIENCVQAGGTHLGILQSIGAQQITTPKWR